MKRIINMRLFFLSCFLFGYSLAHAQLKQISFSRQGASTQQSSPTQIQSTKPSAIPLPFWDDFSFNLSAKGYAYDSLWQFGHSVWVNTGMGINPPTLKVATFDGLDSLGLPYNINTVLAKGVADKLVSKPIRMDLVDPSRQDSVFIFFYYQYQGNGEPPDPGDEFSLWFKQDSTHWNKVWSVGYDTLVDKTKFVPVKLFVSKLFIADTSKSYFHNDFQFRFQNFARLSGPFDTWNLDYVYINNGKSQYGYQVQGFPDRAFATPLTSLLKQYQSIPVKHLLSKGDSLLATPTLTLTNQRKDQSLANNYPQPLSLNTYLKTITRLNKVTSSPVESTLSPVTGIDVYSDYPTPVTLTSLPSFTSFDPNIDSLAMKLSFKIHARDTAVKTFTGTYDIHGKPVYSGDYDTIVFKGIDFTYNDTTSSNFIFSSYYAYDDGTAEYAATLTNAGNSLAYQFDMMYLKPDTLVAVDIYFPHIGDETSQVLQLIVFDNQILDAANTNPVILTQQDLVVARTVNNIFIRVPLQEPVVVFQKFFIGYKQNTSAYIGVGLDKDSDSGDKIFANFGTGWAPADLHGNLMIRPVFGNAEKAKGPITGIEEKKITFYPNPNHGIFYLSQNVQSLQVTDVAGRSVSFDLEDSFESTRVGLHSPSPGIYVARYFDGKQWRTEKIMVLP